MSAMPDFPQQREIENVRHINGAFDPLYNEVDPDFDDMMLFDLHDEHDVRNIMDLPAPVGEGLVVSCG